MNKEEILKSDLNWMKGFAITFAISCILLVLTINVLEHKLETCHKISYSNLEYARQLEDIIMNNETITIYRFEGKPSDSNIEWEIMAVSLINSTNEPEIIYEDLYINIDDINETNPRIYTKEEFYLE